jgi:hypothetical protein
MSSRTAGHFDSLLHAPAEQSLEVHSAPAQHSTLELVQEIGYIMCNFLNYPSIPARDKTFYFLQTGSGTHSSYCLMATKGSSPGNKAAGGVQLIIHFHLVPKLIISKCVPSLPYTFSSYGASLSIRKTLKRREEKRREEKRREEKRREEKRREERRKITRTWRESNPGRPVRRFTD